jgi:CRISPR-associated exonuclease Cas4
MVIGDFQMKIPPSIFNAFNICQRQAWLMSRNLTADQQSLFLEIGRLINETSFEREKREIYLADIHAKIDMITRKNGSLFICEIKKSSKTLETGIFQLKYYLYLLKQKGFSYKGIIKIPKERKSIEVELSENDMEEIKKKVELAKSIISSDEPPTLKRLKICSKCAHFEFCWS